MSTEPMIIGLCGGIASGKSTIAGIFRKLGIGVIDADEIGHLVLKTPRVKQKLIKIFGEKILKQKSRTINRHYLSLISFAHPRNLKMLNRITHPFISKEIKVRLKKLTAKLSKTKSLIVLDAALLMETGSAKYCNYLIFVKAPRKHREQRVAKSRGWSKQELYRREKFQMSPSLKKQQADFVINNTSLPQARQQVQKIFQQLILKPRRKPA